MRITLVTFFAFAFYFGSVVDAHGGTRRLSNTSAACSRAVSAVVVQSSVRFVPFAVPVAVPVAFVNVPSVVYGYSGYSARYAPGVPADRVEPRGLAHPESNTQKNFWFEPPIPDVSIDAIRHTAASVVTNRCTKCHGGDEPKAGFNLSDVDPGELDRDARFKMLRRIMEPDGRKRMPKGGQLSREEFDVLVEALVK